MQSSRWLTASGAHLGGDLQTCILDGVHVCGHVGEGGCIGHVEHVCVHGGASRGGDHVVAGASEAVWRDVKRRVAGKNHVRVVPAFQRLRGNGVTTAAVITPAQRVAQDSSCGGVWLGGHAGGPTAGVAHSDSSPGEATQNARRYEVQCHSNR